MKLRVRYIGKNCDNTDFHIRFQTIQNFRHVCLRKCQSLAATYIYNESLLRGLSRHINEIW